MRRPSQAREPRSSKRMGALSFFKATAGPWGGKYRFIFLMYESPFCWMIAMLALNASGAPYKLDRFPNLDGYQARDRPRDRWTSGERAGRLEKAQAGVPFSHLGTVEEASHTYRIGASHTERQGCQVEPVRVTDGDGNRREAEAYPTDIPST